MSFRKINPEKLAVARGHRSLQNIATASNGAFSRQAVHQWERGECRPHDDKIPALLMALGVTWEDVSDPVAERQVVATA